METKVVQDSQKEDHNWGSFNVAQKVVLWNSKEDRFLLLKEPDSEFFKEHPEFDPWVLLGGHVDTGEDIVNALKREISEEVGDIYYEILGLFHVVQTRAASVSLMYLAEYKGGDIVLSPEHSEYAWRTAEEIENGKIYPRIKETFRLAIERLKEREYLNDVKRVSADFENYKRRQEERVKELAALSAERVALDVMPVLDNFRAAEAHVPEEEKTKAWMTGITYIGKQLEEALANHGLVRYEAKEGEVFDPYLHEAVSHEKGEKEEDGKIVKSLQPGYKIGTRVIRPAKVIVA